MKMPMPRAVSCTVDRYIGSDFDAVRDVSDNIDVIKNISTAADDLNAIGNNLDSLVRLAGNLDTVQVAETHILTNNQRIVTFTKVVPEYMALYVRDARVDSGRLFKHKDYTVQNSTSIELKRTYPEGTQLLAIQEITSQERNSVIYADKTVFNRTVVNFEEGAVLKDVVEYGETIQPLLLYKQRQYICHNPIPIEHKINSTAVYDYGNGYITIHTDKGNLLFSSLDARALTQKDIKKLFHSSWSNIVLKPSVKWEPAKYIDAVTYHIIVEGVQYFPVRVPFTTANTWEEDIANWLPIAGAIPEVIDVTDKNTLEFASTSRKVIVKATKETNIVAFSDIGKYREVLLIPESDNITLVHSPDHLRLAKGPLLKLSTNCVYNFMTDSNGIPRQVI